jgi:hypothetical protein
MKKSIYLFLILILPCTVFALAAPAPSPSACSVYTTPSIDNKAISVHTASTLLENEIRIFFKKIMAKEYQWLADNGFYTAGLADLNITLPSYLNGNGSFSLKIKTDRSGFEATFNTFDCKKYLAQEDGMIMGMHQYDSLSEIETAIITTLYSIYMAETGYYSENAKYTTDNALMGFAPDAALKNIGTTKIILPTATTFKGTFTVTAPGLRGMVNKVYQIDQTRKLTY